MAGFAVEYERLRLGREGVEILPYVRGPSDLKRFAAAGRKVVIVPATVARPGAEVEGLNWMRVGDLYELALKPATRPVDSGMGPLPKER